MAINLILGITLYLAKPINFCKSPYLEPGLCAQQNYYSRKKLHALTHYAILPEERYYTYEEHIADSFKSKGGLISECIIIITVCSKKLVNIEIALRECVYCQGKTQCYNFANFWDLFQGLHTYFSISSGIKGYLNLVQTHKIQQSSI